MKNNQKGFANVVSIAVVIILLAIGGYFVLKGKRSPVLQDNSISSAYIYGPELNKVKVSLYATDEKKTFVTDNYCGGTKDAEIRTGNYKLVIDSKTATSDNPGGNSDINWGDSTLDIGQMQFVQNTAWNGKIIIDQFDPNGYKNFIVIPQYASCNSMYIHVYGYDFSQGKLVEYKFFQGNAHHDPIDNLSIKNFKKSTRGNLVTSEYDNITGKTTNVEWRFDTTENAFEPLQISSTQNETADWQTYRNSNYSFEFKYPSGFSFENGGNGSLTEPVVRMTSDARYPGTNFSGSSLDVSFGTDTKKCLTNVRDNTVSLTEKFTVNGIVFYKDSFAGAAAGTSYITDAYRTLRGNSLCFEVALSYAVSNRQNFENPNSVKEFDPKSELETFNQILSTFKFTK